MKNFLLCLLLFFSISLFSQSKSTISAVIGGDVTWRVFYNDRQSHDEAGDKEKTNYRVGINYERRLTDKVWFKSGVRYAKVGFIDYYLTDLSWGTQHDGSGGVIIIDIEGTSEARKTIDYSFLEIPVMMRFELFGKKWQPFLEIGIANNFYLNTKSELDGGFFDESTREREDDINKYQLSGVVSAGLNYLLTEKYQLFLQPAYRHFITQVDDSSAEIHLTSFGVELGARMRL